MQQICDFCDAIINDTDAACPHCGAPNAHVMRSAAGLPKTIEELKAYAAANHLPLQQMRFFIGENYKEPRAFGIYEENGIFVVYKNKADGTRAIRYQGKDEAYAVNELYQKMHSEIMNRKQKMQQGNSPQPPKKKGKKWLIPVIIGVIVLFNIIALVSVKNSDPQTGYYSYNDQEYYYQNGSWYGYDNDAWIPVTPSSGLTDNFKDYFEGSSYQNGSGYDDFRDSEYYHESNNYYDNHDDNDDWGNNDDWDSGDSWDAGDTDWDSDW